MSVGEVHGSIVHTHLGTTDTTHTVGRGWVVSIGRSTSEIFFVQTGGTVSEQLLWHIIGHSTTTEVAR